MTRLLRMFMELSTVFDVRNPKHENGSGVVFLNSHDVLNSKIFLYIGSEPLKITDG